MANAGAPVDSPLSSVLHRLAAVEPRPAPVVSLYLDLGRRPARPRRLPAQGDRRSTQGARGQPRGAGRAGRRFRADRGRPRRRVDGAGPGRGLFRRRGRRRALHRHPARCRDRRPPAVHRPGAAPLPAGAPHRSAPALCGPAASIPTTPASSSSGWARSNRATRSQREDPPPLDGRLVAGALSAPHREPPAPTPEGGGRAARWRRPRRGHRPGDRRRRRRPGRPAARPAAAVAGRRKSSTSCASTVTPARTRSSRRRCGVAKARRRRRRPARRRRARTRGAAPDSASPVRMRRCARWSSGRSTSC